MESSEWQAGALPRGSIHCARHTIVVHLLRKTKNLRQVQKQLGHTSPVVTANMYADVSSADMQAGLEELYA
ncbi:MAG: tyrosine-type recombinase/integrase [Planctomycetota bacterium]